ncbi:MAG: hypothetical protein ABGX03_00235 [Methylophilaceae bacterium]|jgi:hypothetical protein
MDIDTDVELRDAATGNAWRKVDSLDIIDINPEVMGIAASANGLTNEVVWLPSAFLDKPLQLAPSPKGFCAKKLSST